MMCWCAWAVFFHVSINSKRGFQWAGDSEPLFVWDVAAIWVDIYKFHIYIYNIINIHAFYKIYAYVYMTWQLSGWSWSWFRKNNSKKQAILGGIDFALTKLNHEWKFRPFWIRSSRFQLVVKNCFPSTGCDHCPKYMRRFCAHKKKGCRSKHAKTKIHKKNLLFPFFW